MNSLTGIVSRTSAKISSCQADSNSYFILFSSAFTSVVRSLLSVLLI